MRVTLGLAGAGKLPHLKGPLLLRGSKALSTSRLLGHRTVGLGLNSGQRPGAGDGWKKRDWECGDGWRLGCVLSRSLCVPGMSTPARSERAEVLGQEPERRRLRTWL